MQWIVFDVEANGLLREATRVHCLSYAILEDFRVVSTGSLVDIRGMALWLESFSDAWLVGHNVIQYDLPLIRRLSGREIPSPRVVDTLALSQHLYAFKGFRHGLKQWGERLKVDKPEISDWRNLSLNDYLLRCEVDVEITVKLFRLLHSYMRELYRGDSKIFRLYDYLRFKMECMEEQGRVGIRVDRGLLESTISELQGKIERQEGELASRMPKVVESRRPRIMRKQDGTPSQMALSWWERMDSLGLPRDTEEVLAPGNPSSVSQLKEWLFSLGWVPETFNVVDGRYIPQISVQGSGQICPSIQRLYAEHPYLENLENLYMHRHRLGVLKSFQEHADAEGRVQASAHGLTSTMRFQHSVPVVNLPGVGSPYGREIRGLLTVDSHDQIMFGSDVSALEDSTKQHFMHFFDPNYVREMRVPGFDPHLDIAVLSGLLSREDSEFYKQFREEGSTGEERDRYKRIKAQRTLGKKVNFSAIYGAGVKKIAKELQFTELKAKRLLETYWKRNASVRRVAESFITNRIRMLFLPNGMAEQAFVYSPVSRMWLMLRSEKDRFSAVNQNTGAFIFDSWLRECKTLLQAEGVEAHIILQYHDEMAGVCRLEDSGKVEGILRRAMVKVNSSLELNVPIGISVSWGKSYADCH